jgi:acyl dehydratase
MGSFDDLAVGATFASGARHLDAQLVTSLVGLGGYTHPLFTDPAHLATTSFERVPVPGEAVLLLMGGLVEATGRLDETTIALLGFDEVNFVSPAFVDDAIHVEVTVVDKKPSASGQRGVMVLRWRCLDQDDELLVDATARMLFRINDN